jgi:uncharacterized membrane protein YphA (DoxX/SURF4 family)
MSGTCIDTPPPKPSADPPRGRRLLKAGCRYLLAIAFLASALTKILDPGPFARQVADIGLPNLVADAVTAILPWLELTCGFCLALGVAVREAAAIVCGLLVFFLAYSLFHRGDGDCGCLLFPEALQPINRWPWLPLRNLVLLGCAAWNVRR